MTAPVQSLRTFVLVHGAFHGGWCYARVADLLRAQGHRVFTPTLAGLAERSDDNARPINLTTHINQIVDLLTFEDLQDVVLCGHSYGGMVITGVADKATARIHNLVYLDAVIPEDGKSIADYVFPGEVLMQVIEAAGLFGGGQMAVAPPDSATFFNVNPDDRDMVNRLCTAQQLATLIEKIRLGSGHLAVPHNTFIRAKNWPFPPIEQNYARAKSLPGWELFEIEAGHDVMLDAPAKLAEVLGGLL